MLCLDTSVAILVRDGDERTLSRLERVNDLTVISVVTRVELEGGVGREPKSAPIRRPRLKDMYELIQTLPFDAACADAYARIVQTAGYSRRKILDRMIAAQALVARATLATLNPGDFADIPELRLEDWS